MKMFKRLGTVLIAVCLMTGCTNPMVAVYNNDKKIASNVNTYNYFNHVQTSEDGYFTSSVEKMEGMDTIWDFDAQEDMAINITYTLNVSSGKMKLVFINPHDEISIIAECDSKMEEPVQSTLNVESGTNRIKIVADENTKFDIDISISEGAFKRAD